VSRRLVILDRDGVINHDSPAFIKSPDEWLPIDGSLAAIGALSAAGFDVAVASNQSGVGRKLLDKPTLEAIHSKMLSLVREAGGDISQVIYCQHHPDDDCDCRKPKPGMLKELSRRYGVPMTNVPVIGDSVRDIDAAIAVGARPIVVRTGNGMKTEEALKARGDNVEVYADLADAVVSLIDEARGGR
jgi:D-glycero-D-manno-heptose 1,7-bisphosphate phosphatase